ncbi:NAD(P)/FAD-dependent oxidoreductase [Microbacterium sp. H1-D42]|uniref:FAD-dependent oxidoreductase n=1 Tax=Microbacterium sp. H1-D42 TaxID=2925844 RepID=UPI001F5360C4|nr:NAD(P)/FAD-dependent oxidoreductase [Microbacterium sp. H1-D42]UNK72093.1 FAD-dependent monooxygenase [Microbacterium sp. H1-D42]
MASAEVIIAGAGPVGMLLGCLLAERGVAVMICERRAGVDGRTRAIGVHPPGLAALDAAGVGESVRSEAVALERGEVHAQGRMLTSIAFPAQRGVLILPQRRTDAILRERLQALHVPLRSGCEVVAVRQDESGVTALVRSEGQERAATASFLVVADGVHSGLRDALGIRWRRSRGEARYSMLDAPESDDDPVARLYCEPEGLVESFPLPHGRRRWVVRHAPEAGAMTAEQFAAAIRVRTGIRIPAGEPTAFVASQHRAERVVDGRIILLGDAAHEISPIGGQGMNLGWADALRLTDALIGAAGERGDLAAFGRRSVRAADDVQRRASFYMSMGAPVGAGRQRARELLIRTLGIPPLHSAATALVTMRGI